MIRLQAVNDVVILVKDRDDGIILDVLPEGSGGSIYEIPPPYTGVIDSVGMDNGWKKGDRIAFSDVGGVYMKVDDTEYVVITPDMIIGKL